MCTIVLRSSYSHTWSTRFFMWGEFWQFSISNVTSTGLLFPNKWRSSFTLSLFVPKVSCPIVRMVFTNLYHYPHVLGNLLPWYFWVVFIPIYENTMLFGWSFIFFLKWIYFSPVIRLPLFLRPHSSYSIIFDPTSDFPVALFLIGTLIFSVHFGVLSSI